MISFCQGQKLSCAACCGLYNVSDNSRETLQALLKERSAQFTVTPRTFSGIEAFGASALNEQIGSLPMPGFHHCPYIGFIDAYREKPGCLLHPQSPGNDGRDWRDICHYGGFACRTYFCPSHVHIPHRMLTLLIDAAQDWYAYGLIITRWKTLGFLNYFLYGTEYAVQQPRTTKIEIVRTAIYWILNWPYRKDAVRDRVHYFFNDAEPGPLLPDGFANTTSGNQHLSRSGQWEVDSRQPCPRHFHSSEHSLDCMGDSNAIWIEILQELGSTFDNETQMIEAIEQLAALSILPENSGNPGPDFIKPIGP